MLQLEKRKAGAGIEVTPEMEAAGVDAYMRLLAQPKFTVDQMAREVFEAMTLARRHSHDSLSREAVDDASESDRLMMPTPVKHDLKPGDEVLLEGILLGENVYAQRLVATVI